MTNNNNNNDPQQALDTSAENVILRGHINDAFGEVMTLFTKRISLALYQAVRVGFSQDSRYTAAFDASDLTHQLMLFLTAANAAVIRGDTKTLLEIIEAWKQKMEVPNAHSDY